MNKIIIYVDMDDTIFDYKNHFIDRSKKQNIKYPQSKVGFYKDLPLKENAKDVFLWLNEQEIFDVYILTAPSLENKHSYSEKAIQIENHFGFDMLNKLIISPNKGLNLGHYLIDDYDSGRGQENFNGKLIKFGSKEFLDWIQIKKYFKEKYNLDE